MADYYYGSYIKSGLPDKTIYEIEMNKFKIPKALAVDLNGKKKVKKSTGANTGIIQMLFTEYQINIPVTEI